MEIILASEHLFAGSKREPEVRDRDLSAFVGTARSSESLAALRNRPLPAIFCTANTSDKPYFYTYILHLNTCYVRSRRALTFSPLIFLAHKSHESSCCRVVCARSSDSTSWWASSCSRRSARALTTSSVCSSFSRASTATATPSRLHSPPARSPTSATSSTTWASTPTVTSCPTTRRYTAVTIVPFCWRYTRIHTVQYEYIQ